MKWIIDEIWIGTVTLVYVDDPEVYNFKGRMMNVVCGPGICLRYCIYAV